MGRENIHEYKVGLILLSVMNNSICLWITSDAVPLSALSCRKIVNTGDIWKGLSSIC